VQVSPARLDTQLAGTLAPIYVVHGDEPLLVQEAGDRIRAAARAAGCEQREVLVVEPGFRWDALLVASRNMGLFGGRTLVDLRMLGGKPGTDGARVLEALAAAPSPDAILLLTLPRADRTMQASAWFAALDDAGVMVEVRAPDRAELPAWIASRLARAGQRASPDTLQFLADTTEGNLLAAQQEIDKLALLLPPGTLDAQAVEQAISDVARFDVFALSEAWLAGDAARVVRILGSLESAGEGVPLLVWQLSEDLHALANAFTALAGGAPAAVALRNARVWGRRQAAMERALARVPPSLLPSLLTRLAQLDAQAKGIGSGNAWDALRELALALAGKPVASDGRGRTAIASHSTLT
jgi:DNA polymerase-3 subunit delta